MYGFKADKRRIMVGLCEETVDDDSCPSSNSVVSPVVYPMALIIIYQKSIYHLQELEDYHSILREQYSHKIWHTSLLVGLKLVLPFQNQSSTQFCFWKQEHCLS